MLRGANKHVIWLSASSLGKFGLQKEVSQLESISKLLESLLNSSFSFSISDCFPITFLHFHTILLTEETLFLFIGKFDGFIRDYLPRGKINPLPLSFYNSFNDDANASGHSPQKLFSHQRLCRKSKLSYHVVT